MSCMANLRWQVAAPVLLLLLGVVGILLLAVRTDDVGDPPQQMYGVVLDAGSSHTAMFIYKWAVEKPNGTGVVAQHSECHAKGGGISSYAGQRGGAARSLERCMEQALQDIPKSRHSQTPVYLGATAGMRLLQMSNPKESAEVLREVSDKLKTYPFDFQGAAILSGQEEGAFGWVTVNYLQENFIKYGLVTGWLLPNRQTVGALDFGGASTQITFVTDEKVEDENNEMTLRLYGRDYNLYTQSFLCYGRDQVLLKVLAHLAQSQGYASSITHPCYPAGYNVSMLMEKIFSSPCTADKKPSLYEPTEAVLVTGSGDYLQCVGNVSAIFSADRCIYSSCSFNGVFQPSVTGRYMAFSAFFYTHVFLQRSTGVNVSSPALMKEAAQAVCNLSFNEMVRGFPDQRVRVQDYCTVSVFIQLLLLQHYGFDSVSFPEISFQKTAGGTSIGWALGYMLNLSSLLPAESVALEKMLSPVSWVLLLLLFTLLLLAVSMHLLLLVYHIRSGKDSVI